MAIIEVENITKRFNDKLVLDNVSYSVEKGEVFGFIGPNGAGKSTLINIMTSLLVPDSGTIKICGYDIIKEPIKAKECIGYVPQDLSLMEEMNAYDNLEFFGAVYGLKGKELKERIREALTVTGLEDTKRKKVKKFSGGMKRRLNLAAALLHEPQILLLDEPVVGVDEESRQIIWQTLRRKREEGASILYVTHEVQELQAVCGRRARLTEGKWLEDGEIE